MERFPNSPSHSISGFGFLSFPGQSPAARRFSSWEVFPCHFSDTLSQPLCTHLGPTETCLLAGHWLGPCSCAGGKVRVRTTLLHPAKVMLVLSTGRGVAKGTLGGSYQTYW